MVDTNVWIRYFIRDNDEQYQQVLAWFKEAEAGVRKLGVHPLVVAEVCFVLESFYRMDREKICQVWQVTLAQKWLKVINRRELQCLWTWYVKGFHFVDSFLLAWSHNLKTSVLTFDKKINIELK